MGRSDPAKKEPAEVITLGGQAMNMESTKESTAYQTATNLQLQHRVKSRWCKLTGKFPYRKRIFAKMRS